MGLLKRNEVRKPSLAKETVTVEALGGDVVVRGMKLAERLAFGKATQGDEAGHAQYESVAMVLAWCVLDDAGAPLFTQDEWSAFGSHHLDEAVRLFTVVQRLSLLKKVDVEKKS